MTKSKKTVPPLPNKYGRDPIKNDGSEDFNRIEAEYVIFPVQAQTNMPIDKPTQDFLVKL